MIERIIVAGGGTGGHLFPGIAVVEELRRRNPALEVLFVGTERGIESRVIPKMGERFETVDVGPLKGREMREIARNLSRVPRAIAQCVSIVRREKPDLVLGVGGYASFPMLAAAASLGVKTALLEQNASVGLTNRVLGPMVGRAYVNFNETRATFGDKALVVGNPVRRAFALAARRAALDPAAYEARGKTVLVLGGSQGSRAMNQLVPAALAAVGARDVKVVHQTGETMRAEIEAKYRELGIDAEVVAFIDDMARAYANATLVVGRAGATSLAEMCAIGRASVLVPFPAAADDHQGKNAESLERAGASICVREGEATTESLGAVLASILGDDEKRRTMARAAGTLGKPDAAAAIVDDLCAWIGCVGEGEREKDDEVVEPIDEKDDQNRQARAALTRAAVPYVPRFGARPRRSSVPAHRRTFDVGYAV